MPERRVYEPENQLEALIQESEDKQVDQLISVDQQEEQVNLNNEILNVSQVFKSKQKEKKKIYRFLKEQLGKHTLITKNDEEKREVIVDEALLDRYQKLLFEHQDQQNNNKLEQRQNLYWQVIKPHLVIKKEDIPVEYYQSQVEMARREGITIQMTTELEDQTAQILIKDQEASLEYWYRYLLNNRDNHYPVWFNYFVFRGVIKLGQYDKETQKFKRRRKDTVAPFAELNQEAVALIYDFLINQLQTNQNMSLKNIQIADETAVFKSIKSFNFAELYAQALHSLEQKKLALIEQDNYQGQWVKYEQNSDPAILTNAIKDYSTGWCTQGFETARTQLELGDFYIYFTNNKQGEAKIPMIAIRMERGKVREVRGTAQGQNLTNSKLIQIADEKLATLPSGQEYGTKVANMQKLSTIEDKTKNQEDLTDEEKLFLWCSSEIEGFGYTGDVRLEQIQAQRSIKADLGSIEGVVLPSNIEEYQSLSELSSAQGLVLPEKIPGNLDLRGLQTAKGLQLPKEIEGDLNLSDLSSTEGLILPEKIGGSLYLRSLRLAKGLILPQKIGGNLDLRGLQTAEGLQLPQEIEEDLILSSLSSAEGLVLPQKVGGSLNLENLLFVKDLVLPSEIGGYLDLSGLQSAEGLVLPSANPTDSRLFLSRYLNLTTAQKEVIENKGWQVVLR